MHPPITRTVEPAPEAALPDQASILIDLAELARIVNIARPFARRDQDYKILAGIHFYEHAGLLYAEATDRYAVVRVSSSMTAAPAGLSVVLSATDCIAVLARFRPQRGKRVKLRITLGDDGCVVVRLTDGSLAVGEDMTLTLRPVEGDYPNLDHLFIELAGRRPSADLVVLNTKLLAKLPEEGRVKMVGAGRPVGFYGDGWAAVIQSMRTLSDADPSTNWAA